MRRVRRSTPHEATRQPGSRVAAAGVALTLTRWEHEFGHLEAARTPPGRRVADRVSAASVRAGLAAALLDAGDLEAAERVLGPPPGAISAMPICGFHAVRGRALLARGRANEAIADLEQQLEIERPLGWTNTFREATGRRS